MPARLNPATLRAHHVCVSSDNAFQQRARLLQALWRRRADHPIGERSPGVPLGSRLPLDFARENHVNLMSDAARAAARAALGATDGAGRLIEQDRLYANLLSSQPLCFSLFGPLQADLPLARKVMRDLFPARVADVIEVCFEHSPGRGDARYTGDSSAFDVFLKHTTPDGGLGFIGIEVKYHEGLGDKEAGVTQRHRAIADAMGCFKQERRKALEAKPLHQIWRDHLLAGAMLQRPGDGWTTGLSVFVSPEGNRRCARAAAAYVECLSNQRTFEAVTLERLLAALHRSGAGSWARDVEDRYLGWHHLEAL